MVQHCGRNGLPAVCTMQAKKKRKAFHLRPYGLLPSEGQDNHILIPVPDEASCELSECPSQQPFSM